MTIQYDNFDTAFHNQPHLPSPPEAPAFGIGIKCIVSWWLMEDDDTYDNMTINPIVHRRFQWRDFGSLKVYSWNRCIIVGVLFQSMMTHIRKCNNLPTYLPTTHSGNFDCNVYYNSQCYLIVTILWSIGESYRIELAEKCYSYLQCTTIAGQDCTHADLIQIIFTSNISQVCRTIPYTE